MDLEKADINENASKILMDAAAKIGPVDTFECNLTLDWPNLSIDTTAKLLRTLAQTSKETPFSMEISGIKEGS